EHVGKSSRHQRTAHKVLNAISGGVEGVTNPRIWLIASANSLDGLPPELISRFQVGGIYFFDVPSATEKEGILKLKIAKYKLDKNQPLPKMEDWTGRDVNNCAFKAEAMGMTLEEASKHVVPLLSSHREQMDSLRSYASGRFLSASLTGGNFDEESEMKRFWAKVDKQGPIKSPILGPCWEWMAGLSTDGYGQFWYNGRNRRAHIVAWLLTGKTLPEGLEVCHHCDNPACVRDSHLFIGTHTDNFLDAVEKGRISKGENQHCAMLTENAVRAIRQ